MGGALAAGAGLGLLDRRRRVNGGGLMGAELGTGQEGTEGHYVRVLGGGGRVHEVRRDCWGSTGGGRKTVLDVR